jgi:predicted DNA-binding ribbon-helix-helix protein
MAAKRKKSGRGGRREGAGRKPVLDGARTLSVTLEDSDYEAVEHLAEARGVSFAKVVREAVKAYMARRKK